MNSTRTKCRKSCLSFVVGGVFLSLIATGCLPNLAKQLDPRGAVGGKGDGGTDECFVSYKANAASALGASGTCFVCHKSAGSGNFIIPGDSSSYSAYNTYLQFVDRTNNDPAQSPFIKRGTAAAAHTGGNALVGADLAGVTTWIQREIQGNCGG